MLMGSLRLEQGAGTHLALVILAMIESMSSAPAMAAYHVASTGRTCMSDSAAWRKIRATLQSSLASLNVVIRVNNSKATAWRHRATTKQPSPTPGWTRYAP